MYEYLQKIKFFIFLVICLTGISCKLNLNSQKETDSSERKTFSIVNWNVQTFFDAETDGQEYKDFTSSSKWSKDKYLTRLERLCEVITTLNGDIYVFEEIENEGILYDISNQLAGNSWNFRQNWNYGAFSKDDGASIGCGILSKYPIKNIRTHNFDVRIQSEKQPSVRPVMEVTIEIEGCSLQLFVNHWKSKVGGETESEIWRDWQEFILANEIRKHKESIGSDCEILICGDFNRDINDFARKKQQETGNEVFMRGVNGTEEVVSPWLNLSGGYSTQIGSYYYANEWERIDHFFYSGNLKLTGFSPKGDVPWAYENKTPNGYRIYSGEGYSDHLPIMANFSLF